MVGHRQRLRLLTLCGVLVLSLGVTSSAEAITKAVSVQTFRGLPAPKVDVRVTENGNVYSQWTGSTSSLSVTAEQGQTVKTELRGQSVSPDGEFYQFHGSCPNPRVPNPITNTVAAPIEEFPSVIYMPQVVKELTLPGYEPDEARFLQLINAERAKLGRQPLIIHDRANAVADAQATNLDIYIESAHNGANCETPQARAAELGLTYSNRLLAENVTFGAANTDSNGAVTSFRSSEPHWSSLMTSSFNNAGVATVNGQWAVVLGNNFGSLGSLPSLPRVSPSDPRLRNRQNSGGNSENGSGDGGSPDLTIKKPGKVKLGTWMTARGSAPAGAAVTVSYGSGKVTKTMTTKADSKGNFSVRVKVSKPLTVVARTGSLKASRSITPVSWVSKMKSKRKGRVLRLSGSLKPARAKQRLKLTVVPRKGKKRVYKFRSRKGGKVSFRRRMPSSKLKRATLTVPGVKGLTKANSVKLKLR